VPHAQVRPVLRRFMKSRPFIKQHRLATNIRNIEQEGRVSAAGIVDYQVEAGTAFKKGDLLAVIRGAYPASQLNC
jgi:predicted deacylase